jgi:glutamine amidotransferase
VGWLPTAGERAVTYRRVCPLWADADLPGLAAVTASRSVLAAVRSATEGMPVTEAACAPFTDGRWLFSHNGAIVGWPDSVTALAGALPVRDLLTLPAPTDSALLWALVRARLRAGAPPARALSETVADVATAAPGSRLNLLLLGADIIAATTYGHALSVRVGGGAAVVSSEPLDPDPDWRLVPDGSLVVAATDALRVVELSPTPPSALTHTRELP